MEKLEKKVIIKGHILTITGLHIGGTTNSMSIGGVDNPVIRDPLTNKPYIPGSSLKGKLRSLIEISDGTINIGSSGNEPYNKQDKIAGILFGTANKDDKEQRPSRLIIRDAKLDAEEDFIDCDLPFTELKTEVSIDRINAKANPRPLERVPSGMTFSFEIILNVFVNDSFNDLIENTFRGLKLLQDDYLGGSGSRGSGQVKINIEKLVERKTDYYMNKEQEKNLMSEYESVIKEFELC